MKDVTLVAVNLETAKRLFDGGQNIHYEVSDKKGSVRSSSASNSTCDHFLQEIRSYLKDAVKELGPCTMTFKVSAEEVNMIGFEEILSQPMPWGDSEELYRFIDIYMLKGNSKKFVARYPVTPPKDDDRYMQASSARHSADKAKSDLILSNGRSFKQYGPLEVDCPLKMIDYANDKGYRFNLNETCVIYNEALSFFEFKGSCENIELKFSYRIYDVLLAQDVARAIRTNRIPMPLRKQA